MKLSQIKTFLLILAFICCTKSWATDGYKDLYFKGLDAFSNEQYSLAADLLSQSLSLKPNAITAYYLARAYKELGECDNATSTAVKSLNLNENKLSAQEIAELSDYRAKCVKELEERYITRHIRNALSLEFSSVNSTIHDLAKVEALKEQRESEIDHLYQMLKSNGVDPKSLDFEIELRRASERNNAQQAFEAYDTWNHH